MQQPDGWRDVPFENFDNLTVDHIGDWKSDPDWLVRYTAYATALRLASETLSVIDEYGASSEIAQDLLERLGDPVGGIWDNADTSKRTQVEQGEHLLYEVLLKVLDDLINEESVDKNVGPLAWYIAVHAAGRAGRNRLYSQLFEREPELDINYWIREVTWPDGLLEIERTAHSARQSYSLSRTASLGLRQLTNALDLVLETEKVDVGTFDWKAPFEGLLPDDIAIELGNRTNDLRLDRERAIARGEEVEGIDEEGLTDLWRDGLPILKRRLADKRSMLLVGPTTTGKTDFSRIAAAHMLWQKRKVIVLLPTKALVSQAAGEWREFFNSAESSSSWKVLEASRDHPFNDEDIARGDFDVIIAIPEKLAAYLSGGSQILDQCGLLVVDEMQTLSQSQRGGNLEALLTIIRARHPEIPIIGLSATLTAESSRHLRDWLDVGSEPSEGFISTLRRPVPLEKFAAGVDYWQSAGQLLQAWEPELLSSDLNNTLREEGITRANHRDAVSLVLRLLDRQDLTDDCKSILVFVGSRRAAEKLATGIQIALEAQEPEESLTWASPYRGRFGRLMLDDATAAELDEKFLHLPNLPATNDVRAGLTTGVMYHSARLDPEHRILVEKAFSDKIIRVLVATATLAVGVNLPADYVIVADVTEGTGITKDDHPVDRLLDPHDIAQRFGRCGRLGMSSKGEAYVLVQRSQNRPRQLSVTSEQSNFFRGRSSDSNDDEPIESLIERELSTILGIHDYFITSEDTGEVVKSNLTDRMFARLLLQDISRNVPALTAEEIQQVANDVYKVSLLRVEGGAEPATFDVLDILDSAQLIAPAPEDPKKFKVTGLGRTVALANVPLSNSRGIREVAEAAIVGAGPLTLLCIAAQADYVRDLTWLRLPRENDDLVTQVRSRVWRLVRAFAQPAKSTNQHFEAPEFLNVVADEYLIGSGQSAQSLRGRLDLDVNRLSDATLEAHLRACMSWLWLRGYPMNSITSFVQDNTRSTVRGRTSEYEAHPADVRDLGERLSYVLNAAAEVLRASESTESGQHLTLKNLSESLQSGLPYQLAPMLRLRAPRIHRERLAALLDMREAELDFDDLPGVLEKIATPREDRSAQRKRAHEYLSFTASEVEQILRQMSRRRSESGARSIPPELRNEKIPARRDIEGFVTYGRVANDMARKRSLDVHAVELRRVLEEFGLTVSHFSSNGMIEMTVQANGDAPPSRIFLFSGELRRVDLPQFGDQRCSVIVFGDLSLGAEYELRSRAGHVSAMSIWVLLTALARIGITWRRSYSGPDAVGELPRRVVAFLSTVSGPVSISDVSLAEVAAGLPAPPPFFST